MAIDQSTPVIHDNIILGPDGSWLVGVDVGDDKTICVRVNNRSMCITQEQASALLTKLTVALQEWERLFGPDR